jgi:hypothetical protein
MVLLLAAASSMGVASAAATDWVVRLIETTNKQLIEKKRKEQGKESDEPTAAIVIQDLTLAALLPKTSEIIGSLEGLNCSDSDSGSDSDRDSDSDSDSSQACGGTNEKLLTVKQKMQAGHLESLKDGSLRVALQSHRSNGEGLLRVKHKMQVALRARTRDGSLRAALRTIVPSAGLRSSSHEDCPGASEISKREEYLDGKYQELPAYEASQDLNEAECFNFKPSVGSWLTVLHCADERMLKVEESQDKAFNLKPSVGTWLSLLRGGQTASEVMAQAENELVEESQDKPFNFKASVGTWLSLLPSEQTAKEERAKAENDLLVGDFDVDIVPAGVPKHESSDTLASVSTVDSITNCTNHEHVHRTLEEDSDSESQTLFKEPEAQAELLVTSMQYWNMDFIYEAVAKNQEQHIDVTPKKVGRSISDDVGCFGVSLADMLKKLMTKIAWNPAAQACSLGKQISAFKAFMDMDIDDEPAMDMKLQVVLADSHQ